MSLVLWLLGVAVVSYGLGWAITRLVLEFSPRGRSAPAAPERRRASAGQIDEALAPVREALEATRRPVAHIALEDFPEDTPTASKVGGCAWWPAGVPAPAGEGGQAMVLLAQVDLAEVPEMAGWPREGLLQFFIAPDDTYGAHFDESSSEDGLCEQRNFRVAYHRDTTGPAAPLPALLAGWRGNAPHEPGQPRRMRFSAGTELLSAGDRRFNALFGGDAFGALKAWACARGDSEPEATALASDVLSQLERPGHKLGGYPMFTQNDPRTSDRFELLLQLDTDEHMMWGDAGVGAFFIAPEDLARGDFRRVLYNWDCC